MVRIGAIMSKDLWMLEYEQIAEDFYADRVDLSDVRHRLKKLGFDAEEIDDHVAALCAPEPAQR